MADHKTLSAALVAAQGNMKDPRLTGDNPHFHSKFVPRDEALDSVLSALHAEGLALTQSPCSDERGYGVRTMLFHAGSQETHDFGAFTVKPQKDDPQGAVAATTYASRTAIMLVFARAGDPDDDGNTASEKPKPEPKSEPKAAPAQATGWAAIVESYTAHDTRKAVLEALGNPTSPEAALAAYDALSKAEQGRLALTAVGAT